MANQVTTTFSINAQQALAQLAAYQQQLRNTIQLQTQLGSQATNPGGGGGGTGSGGGIGAGIGGWIAGAVSTAAVISAIKTTTAAVKESEAANRALGASAIEAGKSYSALAESSKRFGDAALISESAAARSTAQLQRLLTLAGQGDQLEKYQKGFLDLAAARGVAFDELDTLFQGIIAGTDDALNRFGKQDPSKLAEQYARSIGKSTDALTEQEKILSRLKAFDTDFGLFNGANEDRVKSFGGAVDRLNKSVDDLITNFGKWASQSRVVRDNLQFLNDAAGGLNLPDRSKVQDMFRAGKTDRQIAQALGAENASWYDYLLSVASFSIGNAPIPAILGLKPVSPSNIRRGERSSILSAIAAERKIYERDSAAPAPVQETSPIDEWRAAQLKAADAARKASEEAAKAEQERLEKMKQAMRSVRDIMSGIAGQQNPFVSIFENAYQSLIRLKELTKDLGASVRDAAYGAVARQSALAYQDSRISNVLARQGLLTEAQTFRDAVDITQITDEQRRAQALDTLQRQLTAIGAFRYGLGGGAERQALDRQIIDLTRGVNPAELDSQIRDLAASAREREATRLSQQEQEARDTFRNLNKILSADGIRVLLGDGEQIVRIVNESDRATVERRPGRGNTEARYTN